MDNCDEKDQEISEFEPSTIGRNKDIHDDNEFKEFNEHSETIVKLLEIINEERDETAKKPRIILDSGFRASIIENNLQIYHYSDILTNKGLDKLNFDTLEEFHNLIT